MDLSKLTDEELVERFPPDIARYTRGLPMRQQMAIAASAASSAVHIPFADIQREVCRRVVETTTWDPSP